MQKALVDLDVMSALGLVVTELLANCFEHAFPDNKGSIHISLAMTPLGERLIVAIRDDGVGFPVLVNGKRNGIGLVKRLIEQLGGNNDASFRAWHRMGSDCSDSRWNAATFARAIAYAG